jgi:hypothetical protein
MMEVYMNSAKARQWMRIWARAPKMLNERKELLRACLELKRRAYTGAAICNRSIISKSSNYGDGVAWALTSADTFYQYAKKIRRDMLKIERIRQYVDLCVTQDIKTYGALRARYRMNTPWQKLAETFNFDKGELTCADRRAVQRIIRGMKSRSDGGQR